MSETLMHTKIFPLFLRLSRSFLRFISSQRKHQNTRKAYCKMWRREKEKETSEREEATQKFHTHSSYSFRSYTFFTIADSFCTNFPSSVFYGQRLRGKAKRGRKTSVMNGLQMRLIELFIAAELDVSFSDLAGIERTRVSPALNLWPAN